MVHTDSLLLWELRQIKWQINPSRKWQFEIHTNRFLIWELRQIKWQIYPPGEGNLRFILIDFYSESSGRPGSRSLSKSTPSPQNWWFVVHTDSLLLWELRQIKWQINPSRNGNLRFILIDSYSESSGRPGDRSTSLENRNLRFILIDFYSESSGRSSGRSTSPENGNLRFILIDCYSESSGRPGGRSVADLARKSTFPSESSGRSKTPHKMIWDSYW